MKVVIDDKIPYIRGEIEPLVDDVSYMSGSRISNADVADADIIIIRTRTQCDQELLEGSRVKLVVTATIGYDHIDTSYLESKGIAWTNCPGCNASSVMQYVHNSLYAIGKLKRGLVAGVVGVGHVGTLVADDLESEGLVVMRCDPPKGEPYTLDDIARNADIITFHTPLTNEGECPTHHLADRDFFDRIQHRAVIINSSRGGVVDEAAMLQAFEKGQVAAMIIDTWENEPNINKDLLDKAVIATPHIAGYSADGKANATRMSIAAVCRFLGKKTSRAVVPPALPAGFRYGKSTDGCLRLYDPRVDSSTLKSCPENFEKQRGNYPLRRENDILSYKTNPQL